MYMSSVFKKSGGIGKRHSFERPEFQSRRSFNRPHYEFQPSKRSRFYSLGEIHENMDLGGRKKKFWQRGAFKTVARVAGGVVGFMVGGPVGAAIGSGLVKVGERGIKKSVTAKQWGKGIKEGVKVGAVTAVASYAATKLVPGVVSKGGLFTSGLKYAPMAKSLVGGSAAPATAYQEAGAGPSVFTMPPTNMQNQGGPGESMFQTTVEAASQILPVVSAYQGGQSNQGSGSFQGGQSQDDQSYEGEQARQSGEVYQRDQVAERSSAPSVQSAQNWMIPLGIGAAVLAVVMMNKSE